MLTRSGFPNFVNDQMAPAVVGDYASMNPTATVLAGAGALVAAAPDVSAPAVPIVGPAVGSFAWAVNGIAYGVKRAGAALGFVGNELQTVITTFLGMSRLTVQAGFPITLFSHGDFWALVGSATGAVAVGDTIYADQESGAPTTVNGVAVVTANQTGASSTMTITAVASGIVRPGAVLSGTNVDPGLTVLAQLTTTETDGSYGKKGTYTVSTTTGFTTTTVTTDAQNPDTGFKAASAVPADASFTGVVAAGTGVLTVSSSSGVISVGQFLQGVGTPVNAQIIGRISGTGGDGTYQLSYNGPAVSSGAMSTTEGKLVKISRTY